jgi:quercetin dioxygenase-like cupin family protein
MHVSPHDFRAVRAGQVTLRFAELGPVVFVFADIPAGTTGTALEEPCERPHWGFVLEGPIHVERGDARSTLEAGTAFHIPGGAPAHRLLATGPARAAGFELLDPDVRTGDADLRKRGFQIVSPKATVDVPSVPASVPARGRIESRFTRMGSLGMALSWFGPLSGYASTWCDLPHWGIVIDGRVAIEWEDSIEVLTAGDVFRCPEGPPGHRIQAADPAFVLDLTPLDAVTPERRAVEWRRGLVALRSPARRTQDVIQAPIG